MPTTASKIMALALLLSALAGLGCRMRFIEEEYEAKLLPHEGNLDAKGKLEWKRYRSGHERLVVRSRLPLENGAIVEVRIDGAVIGKYEIEDGWGRLEFESEDGQVVPKATTGQVAEVTHEGTPLLRGTFYPD